MSLKFYYNRIGSVRIVCAGPWSSELNEFSRRNFMETPKLEVAQLDPERLAKVKELESELGAIVVAYQPTYRPANLDQSQLARLRDLESELGFVLVAFTPD
jgi:hypothetical protein